MIFKNDLCIKKFFIVYKLECFLISLIKKKIENKVSLSLIYIYLESLIDTNK